VPLDEEVPVRRDVGRVRLAGPVLLATVALVAAGCTSGGPPAPTSGPSVGGSLIWWDISTRTGALAADKGLVAAFEGSHPGVTVDVQVYAPEDARARFDTAAQTSSGAPDVLTVDTAWVSDFASRGYLSALDNTAAADAAARAFPVLLPTEKWDGRVYAAARSVDGLALLYNPALLRAAGVAVPKTWGDLSAASLRLTARDVQTLYAPSTGEGLLPFVYGEGGSLADPEAKLIQVSQPAAVAGLARRISLQATGVAVDDRTDGVTAPPTSSADTSNATPADASVDAMRAAFRQGRVAMILDSASAIPSLVGGAAFPTQADVGVAPVPSGSVRASGPVTVEAYAVYAGSTNVTTANSLVAYLDTPESQGELAQRLGLVPAQRATFQRPEVKADPVVSAFEAVVQIGTPLPQVVNQQALLPPLTDALRKGLAGQGSAQSNMDDAAVAYQRVLPGYDIGSGG
jgi:arabinogalactan oligomer/maltooligosaccharide transport system substrate-binding protein